MQIETEIYRAHLMFRRLGDFAADARIGQEIRRLLAHCSILTISVDREDGQVFASTVGRETSLDDCDCEEVLDALVSLTAGGPAKRCATCKRSKPLAQFSRCRRAKDGKNFSCKVCERKRVQVATQKRRSGLRAAPS